MEKLILLGVAALVLLILFASYTRAVERTCASITGASEEGVVSYCASL